MNNLIQEQIATCCKRLKLNKVLADNCFSINGETNQEYLLNILQAELEGREQRRRNRLLNTAGFYMIKTFENYSFEGIKIPSSISIESIKQCKFVNRKENLILYGGVGSGKTHMSTAIGVNACGLGLNVLFFRTATIVNILNEKQKGGELSRFMKKLSKADLIVFDEWGFVPLDRTGAQLLFQVISDCYEKTSIIITTNLEFSKWVNVFYDEQMTAAMIDRIIHYSHLLIFDRASYRTEHSLMKGS
jgi:DNA replication protein DnaC